MFRVQGLGCRAFAPGFGFRVVFGTVQVRDVSFSGCIMTAGIITLIVSVNSGPIHYTQCRNQMSTCYGDSSQVYHCCSCSSYSSCPTVVALLLLMVAVVMITVASLLYGFLDLSFVLHLFFLSLLCYHKVSSDMTADNQSATLGTAYSPM